MNYYGEKNSIYYANILTDKGEIYLRINWDNNTKSYDIALIKVEEYENCINTEVEKINEKSIERNANNSIPYKDLDEVEVIKKYFLDYINTAVNFPEEAYKYINEEYRKAKFGTIENYKKYVEESSDIQALYKSANLKTDEYSSGIEYFIAKDMAKLEKYSIRQNFEEPTQYMCIDSFDNYYIFTETGPMQYTIVLDTYTIDIPEFTEKYNVSNDQEKVILNLNKFMLGLNDKDYKYLYSLLADSFKKSKFPTYESFETYAKTNFFKENKFEYKKYGSEAGTYYTYTVEITDSTKEINKKITKTFIILLEEGTNFKLSFNV